MPDRRHLQLGAWALLVLSGGTSLWACSPDLPGWLLGDDHQVLASPRSCLWKERLDQLLPAGVHPASPILRRADEPPEEPLAARGAAHTAAAEEADFTLALANATPERRRLLLDGVRTLRASFRALAAFNLPGAQRPRIEAPIPAGLPGELADYLAAAAAYHEHRFADARRTWERLLARPAAERRQRSVWAAFMLGRVAMKQTPGNPEEALRRFAETRQLAGQGFSDRLGLAAASRGWEGRVELDRDRYARAAEIYLDQYAAGEPAAVGSLDLTCRKARRAGRPALVAMARSPRARTVMTALLDPSDVAGAAAWLAAVQEAGVTRTDGADGLACVAYAAGNFAAARAWLDRAPADAPMASWIRAKLLLREGRLAAAAPLLGRASQALQVDRQAAGDAGVVEVSLGRYTAALDHLRSSHGQMDAAYVAERLLTTGELTAYVDRVAPASTAVDDPPGNEEGQELRQLLARRLAREGRFAKARRYLPPPYRPALDTLAAGLAAEHQTRRAAPVRAARLFAAACVARQEGMEILGTEVEPDWALEFGMFDLGGLPGPESTHSGDSGHAILKATADERRRAARTRVRPDKRFHYRYVAADLARRAAALLPDGTEEKARYLATAGSWLKLRDPAAALPYYRLLVRTAGDTPTGRAARAIHWFPTVDACPPASADEMRH